MYEFPLDRYSVLLNSILVISLLSFFIISNFLTIPPAFAEAQQQQQHQQTSVSVRLIPSITQNIHTIVSFLLETSSFILGMRIQNLARSTARSWPTSTQLPILIMNKYFEFLLMALVNPSMAIIVYGIIIVGVSDPGEAAYLLLLFALFIPTGADCF